MFFDQALRSLQRCWKRCQREPMSSLPGKRRNRSVSDWVDSTLWRFKLIQACLLLTEFFLPL